MCIASRRTFDIDGMNPPLASGATSPAEGLKDRLALQTGGRWRGGENRPLALGLLPAPAHRRVGPHDLSIHVAPGPGTARLCSLSPEVEAQAGSCSAQRPSSGAGLLCCRTSWWLWDFLTFQTQSHAPAFPVFDFACTWSCFVFRKSTRGRDERNLQT